MQWFEFAWVAAVTSALFAVLGIPLARIIGLRGFWAVAVAPAFAVTVIAGSAVVAPMAGLTWSVLPVVLVALALALVLGGIRHLLRARAADPAPRAPFDPWLLVALVGASVLLSMQVVGVIGAPDSISQTFDNVFHLNGVRFVLDTGNASSLWIGRMTNPGGALGFYPAAWHGLVSLVVQLSGASIPLAVNAVTFTISAVVWPLGILLLTRTLFGRAPVLSVTAGLLAASLPVFPILLMDYGVLYPFQLGVALLPVALAATLRLLGLAPGGLAPGRLWWAIVLLGTIPGLALAHPGAFVAWLALSAPMGIVFAVVRWRAAPTVGIRWLVAIATVGYLIVGAVLVLALRPPREARGWPIQMTMGEALFDVVTMSAWYGVPAVLAAITVVAGIVWACVRRTIPALVALGMYVVVAVLFISVASLPLLGLRDAFTGPWYNNLPRLAALLPIALVPLGAWGASLTWQSVAASRALRSWSPVTRSILAGVTAIAALLAFQVGPLGPVSTARLQASYPYILGPSSLLLSSDERALLSRIDEHVPEGVAIAGSPWTGTSLAYALADRPVLMPHLLMEVTPGLHLINDGLADAEKGDAVCAALAEYGVGFVLEFGAVEVHGGEHVFPGFEDLSDSDAVRLIDQQGDARLYEIVACDA